jgi:enolase-phosphatase E1
VSTPASAILLDIEGTTTPIDFVYRVLFPFARERYLAFLTDRFGEPEVAADVRVLAEEHRRDASGGQRPPAWEDSPEAVAAYASWLTDRDRKSTPLKSLQGRIWEEGFRAGLLQSRVYDDVPRALARWTEAGKTVAVFSSGSVRAQRMLFAHTQAGDLTPHLSEYFDTSLGFKSEPESYRRIATRLRTAGPAAILFVSGRRRPRPRTPRGPAGMQTASRPCARSDSMPIGRHAPPGAGRFDRLG